MASYTLLMEGHHSQSLVSKSIPPLTSLEILILITVNWIISVVALLLPICTSAIVCWFFELILSLIYPAHIICQALL